MIPYLLAALWPLFMMYFYEQTKSCTQYKPSTLMIICTVMPMFILIAIRDISIGADTLMYYRHFVESLGKTVSEMSAVTRMEEGYLVFVRIASFITSSPKVFQILYSCIYMVGFVSFARQLKESDSFMFFYYVCTLGLFFFFFTGVRQCIAISICLFSYQYLIRKKYWVLIPLIVLAYTFHKSSVLFLLVLFVWNKNLKWSNYLLYIIFIFFVGRYLLELQMWFNESLDYNYEIEDVGGGQIFLVLLSILTIFSHVIIKRKGTIDLYTKSLFNINIITIAFWILRLQTRVAERPSFYFLAFTCALFAYCTNKLPKNGPQSIYRYMIIAATFVLYVYRLSHNYTSFIPYSTFLWTIN